MTTLGLELLCKPTSQYHIFRHILMLCIIYSYQYSILYFRWKLVIHGGIDGHTRIPVYLKCSPNNRADTVLECLHFVFIPRINDYLNKWQDGWNRHHIRTAGNRTPLQLYIMGLLRGNSSRSTSQEPLEEVCTFWVINLHPCSATPPPPSK